jgi:hypothetical protein
MIFEEARQFEEPEEVWLTNLPQIAPFGSSNGIIHQFRFHVDKKIFFPDLPCSIGHALWTL